MRIALRIRRCAKELVIVPLLRQYRGVGPDKRHKIRRRDPIFDIDRGMRRRDPFIDDDRGDLDERFAVFARPVS